MKKIITGLILIGVIGISLNTIFGWQTFTFLNVYRTGNNIYLYKFDAWHYIENLKNSFQTVSELGMEIPPRQWINITASFLEAEFWESLGNNMALMLDWFLFAISIFLYPTRVTGYFVLNLLAILGINTIEPNAAGGLNWLVILCKFLRDLQIPYV